MEEKISMQIMMRLRQIIQEMSRHSKQLQEKSKITLPPIIPDSTKNAHPWA